MTTTHIIEWVNHFRGAGGLYYTTIYAYCGWFYSFPDDSIYGTYQSAENEDNHFHFFKERDASEFDCEDCKAGHGLMLLAGVA